MPVDTRIVNPVRSPAVAACLNWAAFTGTGASAPVVSAASVLPLKDNYAAARDGNTTIITRNGIGDHTYTFPTAPTAVLFITGVVPGTLQLDATVNSWDIVNGRLVVHIVTWTPGGVNTDMGSGDMLRLKIEGNLSNA